MSYANTPGGEQDYPAGPQPPEFGAPPPYPGQGEAAGPPGWGPGQQVPPGYGPSGYGPPMYGPPPGYGPPGYGPPANYGYVPPAYAPPGPPPPTYGGWAVTALIGGVLFSLLVGLPAAIAGLTYGSKSTKLWAIGDWHGAAIASRKARGWLTASTIFDLLGVILLVFLFTRVSSTVHFTSPAVAPAPAAVQVVPASVQSQQPYLSPGCHHHMMGP